MSANAQCWCAVTTRIAEEYRPFAKYHYRESVKHSAYTDYFLKGTMTQHTDTLPPSYDLQPTNNVICITQKSGLLMCGNASLSFCCTCRHLRVRWRVSISTCFLAYKSKLFCKHKECLAYKQAERHVLPICLCPIVWGVTHTVTTPV